VADLPKLAALKNAADLVAELPPIFANAIDPEDLRSVWVIPPQAVRDGDITRYDLAILFDKPIALSIPGLDAVQLVVGAAGDASLFQFEVQVLPSIKFTIKDVAFALRFRNDYLKPARINSETNAYEIDPTKPALEIGLGTISFSFDLDGGVQIDTNAGIALPATMIGDSGVAIKADNIQPFLTADAQPPQQPQGAKGVFIQSAQVFLPGSLSQNVTLSMTNAFIGNGGFSGTVSSTIPGVEQDLGGVTVTLNQVSLTFVQNALIDSTLTGTVLLPYFDKLLQVALTVGLDGSIALVVTGVAPGNGTYNATTGILTLDEGPLRFDITRLELDFADGTVTFHGAGSITPTFAGITFPTFQVEDFSIDSHGNLSVKGGWIDLPSHLSLSLYGFTLEITKIGFGAVDTPEHRRWIGFSGGLSLVDGLSAGASVDGLRLLWNASGQVTIAMDGVGLSLDIPDVLTIKGAVSLKGQEFRGGVEINVKAAQLELGGQFVAGRLDTGQKYFAVFVHCDLPVGIPLFTTGLSIYGAAGLYAQRMVPDKHDNEGWYLNPDGGDGWYLRQVPGSVAQGVEDLGKWKGSIDGLGFGAGITLGTATDNGFSFNGRLLLVLSFPGPVVIIEGKANLFKKRSALSDDAMFRALVVFDPKSSFLIAMDAKYNYRSSGELLEIGGSAEAFFDLNDPTKWHIWLGQKDNRARRIRARAFQLFDVDGYFMLDARQFQIGASWSFNKHYGFKRLRVDVGASLEAGASVSWHPAHLAGSVAFEGHVKLRAFGVGLGLSVGASIGAEVFEPFHLKGNFRVGIDLPWPLPDVGATITLEWGGSLSAPPPLPLPLREAAAEFGPRHLRWPFLRGTNLLPNNDQGDLEFASSGTVGDPETAGYDFGQAMKIPVDAQLSLSFSRSTDDPNMVGNNPNPNGLGAETVGDPVTPAGRGYQVAYSFSSAVLEKLAPIGPTETSGGPIPTGQQGTGWVPVAQTGETSLASQNLPAVFGVWSPTAAPPQMTEEAQAASGATIAQTKLVLNAKSPFESTSVASQVWDQWFTDTYPGYPCSPPGSEQNFVDVFTQPVGTQIGTPVGGFEHFKFDDPAFDVHWQYGGDIAANEEVVAGVLGPIDRGLRIFPDPLPSGIITGIPTQIRPPPGLSEVDIRVGTPQTFVPFSQRGQFVLGNDPNAILDRTVVLEAFQFVDGERDETGVPAPHIIRRTGGEGLAVDFSMSLRPEEPALEFQLELVGFSDEGGDARADVLLFDAVGNSIPASPDHVGSGAQTVRYRATDATKIAEVVVTSTVGFFLIHRIEVRTPVKALVQTATGIGGTFVEQNGVIKVVGTGLGTIWLSDVTGGQFLILEIAIPSRKDDVIRHTIASLAQFSEQGPVLEPETHYRMTVRTVRSATHVSSDAAAVDATTLFKEQMYFRAAALPGIGVPAIPAGTQTGTTDPSKPPVTGFEDLSLYVKSTIPEVPPPAGGHLTPARAVYRAYDANVEFSEETPYVELMYRRGRRDLTLRLFDADNQPLAGPDGRVLVADSHWRPSEQPAIAASTAEWVAMVKAVDCAPTPDFDDATIIGSRAVAAPNEEAVLAPLTLHQARLVPMLLHETFTDARAALVANGQGFQLDRWRAEQFSIDASAWHTQSETTTPPGAPGPVTTWFVTEDRHVVTTLVYDGPLASKGETEHKDHPSKWTDLRASVQIRWQSGLVGFEFRRTSNFQTLRVTLDRATGTRQLVVVGGGQTNVLAQDTVSFPSAETDVILTVECVRNRVQVFQQIVGEPQGDAIFDVSGVAQFSGTVALFSNGAFGTRFTEISVHDLRQDPSTAFRFDFITSKYTGFNHHLHAFDDQLFAADGAGLSAAVFGAAAGAAVPVPGSPTGAVGLGEVLQAEARAFDDMEQATLGSARLRTPQRIEILRASPGGATSALLVRSPEPIRWERTTFVAQSSTAALDLGVPGDFKLTGVTFSTDPQQERVGVLVRNAAAIARHTLQWRPLPDAATPDPAWTDYFTFADDESVGDGVEIEVYSGAASGTVQARAVGTEQRFVAATTAEAATHFPATGVELRLRALDGTVVHHRQFVPDGSYASLDMSAVRKPDGTCLFLFPAGGGALPSGAKTLRLRFTFKRNAGPGLSVLRQAGSDADEVVVLEVSLV
jgi:hypothetical protein